MAPLLGLRYPGTRLRSSAHARAWHRHKQDNLESRQIKLIILRPFLWNFGSLVV